MTSRKKGGTRYCIETGKICHSDPWKAQFWVWPGMKRYIYVCPFCGWLHLTKKNQGKGKVRLWPF